MQEVQELLHSLLTCHWPVDPQIKYTYRWIVRYKSGHDCNISNLRRTCRRNDISSPLLMSLEEALLTHEAACKKKLEEYRKSAPELRVKLLQERLSVAKKRKDEDSEKAIIQILRREHDRKKYRRLSYLVHSSLVWLKWVAALHVGLGVHVRIPRDLCLRLIAARLKHSPHPWSMHIRR